MCSHKACSERGVRFVFCSVCDQPAAVGNFTSRHSHQDVLADNDKRSSSKKAGDDSDLRRNSKPQHKKRKHSSSSSKPSLKSLVYHPQLPAKKRNVRSSLHDKQPKHYSRIMDDNSKIVAVDDSRSESRSMDNITGMDAVRKAGSVTPTACGDNSHEWNAESSNSSSSSTSGSGEAGSEGEYDRASKRGRDRSSTDVFVPPSTVIPVYDDSGKNKRSGAHVHKNDGDIRAGSRSSKLRAEMWLKLLSNRPRDTESDEMSAWLMATVAVSDPEADITNNVAVQRFIDSLEDASGNNTSKMP